MSDLVRRLRALSAHEHSDLTIGDEAADRIAELEDEKKHLDAQLAGSRAARKQLQRENGQLHYDIDRHIAALSTEAEAVAELEVERDQYLQRATNQEFQVTFMCREIARALSLPVEQPGDTVTKVRILARSCGISPSTDTEDE